MIPIQLTIEGLYSYQSRQKIDFNKLTEAGLFGIFGAVGSGKSSILEAITFALYGETERLNSKDKRAYNMMNLKSNKSFIEFDFSNFNNEEYRITREFKRNSKKYDDVKSTSVLLSKKVNGEWIPQESSNVEEIIGLSYTNFKRTIIIPQGQFKEFLELGETDRTKMMKEIFGLQRFDLQDKVSILNKKNQTELDQITGELKGFENISEEEIETQKHSLIEAKTQLETSQNDFNKINDSFQRLKALKSDIETLHLKISDFEKLKLEENYFKNLEKQINEYEKLHQLFHLQLLDLARNNAELLKNKKLETEQSENLKELHKIQIELSNQIKLIETDYQNLTEKKLEENDLSFIISILNNKKEINHLEESRIKGNQMVVDAEKEELEIKNTIKIFEEQVVILNSKKVNSEVLQNAGEWFQQQNTLKESLENQKKTIEGKKQEIISLDKEIIDLGIHSETYLEDFEIKNQAINNRKTEFEKTRDQLKIQQQLSQYANHLHDGEACPLCGSQDHPSIIEISDVTHKLEEISKELLNLENDKSSLQKLQSSIDGIFSKKEIHENQLQIEIEKEQSFEAIYTQHQSKFIWKEFNSNNIEDFNAKKIASNETEKQIGEKNKEINELRSQLESKLTVLKKYKERLEIINNDWIKKKSNIDTNLENLKKLSFIHYQEKPVEEVEAKYNNAVENNNKIQQDYTRLSTQLNELLPKIAAQETLIQTYLLNISEAEKNIELLNNTIAKQILTEKIESLEYVRNILGQNIDIANSRAKIQEFTIKYETLKNSISELQEKLKDISFDDETFEVEQQKFNDSELQLQSANNIVVKIVTEIDRLEKEFNKKKDILVKKTGLEKRADHLKTMFNLFKGAGFVQYVSSIYLRQLCDNANVRFKKMTRNQLSLQLDDKGNFEIIDYLNEGKPRSVKTLSGGQGFQASLSLALALAESVQSNAKADKNFFFIDEGFGTQDADSVNIVFETLSSLQKENRIVGIISHVEELKERIPMSLSIVKDEINGSLIETY